MRVNPCIGCKDFWHAGRGCSCQDFCPRLKEYKEETKEEAKEG